jgi:hypothetical protein
MDLMSGAFYFYSSCGLVGAKDDVGCCFFSSSLLVVGAPKLNVVGLAASVVDLLSSFFGANRLPLPPPIPPRFRPVEGYVDGYVEAVVA